MSDTGPAHLAAYLEGPFREVPGMSSRFAADIVTTLMAHQARHGVRGHAAEIGTYKGRFFIALALALAEGEIAVGIDHFRWPTTETWDAFLANCRAHGVPQARMAALKLDTWSFDHAAFGALLGERKVRLFHVDGEHTRANLRTDLAIARRWLAPGGVIVLDDMLHPAYPQIALEVHAFLGAHPELRVFCVIDREDIVAAPKYMIAEHAAAEDYMAFLDERYAQQRFVLMADFEAGGALILTPEPRLAIL